MVLTVVSTPLIGVNLDMDGIECGSFSKDFGFVSFKNALTNEIDNWCNGNRNPFVISEYWRNKNSLASIGREILMHLGYEVS